MTSLFRSIPLNKPMKLTTETVIPAKAGISKNQEDSQLIPIENPQLHQTSHAYPGFVF